MHGLTDITINVRGLTEIKFFLMVSLMIFVLTLKDLEHWISRLVLVLVKIYTEQVIIYNQGKG
jgi:hypothetical protein